MSVVTELTVDAEAFVLGHALDAVPEMRVEGERLVTHSEEWVLPFLAATGGSFERFERALAEDATVASFSRIDAFEDRNRYRVRWAADREAAIRSILDREGAVIDASASDGVWHLAIEFVDREQLGDLQRSLDGSDGAFQLERLYEPERSDRRVDRLTPQQRETLVLARDMGYFSVPREATVEDLADRLDISPGAVSERLRRGSETLVDDALPGDCGSGDP